MPGRWYYSGEQITEISKKNLFLSRQVEDFLGDPRKLILLSSKGMGKTHLLRQKRADLSKNSDRSGIKFIPVSLGSDVDRQGAFPSNLGRTLWNSISENEWTKLWEVSIAISVIMHAKSPNDTGFEDVCDKLIDFSDLDECPETISNAIFNWMSDESYSVLTPIEVLNGLLKQSISSRKSFMSKIYDQVVRLYRTYVTNGINVFIDSVDQALSETEDASTEIWAECQCGLAVAIYFLSVNCPHIKVYSAIRQEAWNRFEHENKEVIESHCTRLEYSKKELREMLDFLAGRYEGGVERFSDVFGTCSNGTIRNFGVKSGTGSCVEEDLFEYLYRHSLGSPRSLLHIANGVCTQIERSQPCAALEKDIRREVNLKAGGIAETKMSEMSKFLDFFSDPNKRVLFYSLLRGNVLRANELYEVVGYLSDKRHDIHPFCELYNIGLIGTVKRDSDGDIIQRFKSPMEFEWHTISHIPESPYYVLHPALEALLSEKYVHNVEEDVVVANMTAWLDEWSRDIDNRTFKIFISYSTQNSDLRDRVISSLSRIFLRDKERFEVWVDVERIGVAEPIGGEIDKAIEWADAMICLASSDYLQSGWCTAEMKAMQTASMSNPHKRLFPFVVDGVKRKQLGALLGSNLIPEIDSSDELNILDAMQRIVKWLKQREQS